MSRSLRTVPDAVNAQAVFADATDGILCLERDRKAGIVNKAINAHGINNMILQEQEMEGNES